MLPGVAVPISVGRLSSVVAPLLSAVVLPTSSITWVMVAVGKSLVDLTSDVMATLSIKPVAPVELVPLP